MIKSLIVGISCLIIFTSFTEVVAQEEISITIRKKCQRVACNWNNISFRGEV